MTIITPDPEEEARIRSRQLQSVFHVKGGWFFCRTPENGVAICHDPAGTSVPEHEVVRLTAEEWASVVASASVSGENRERWQAALKFQTEQVGNIVHALETIRYRLAAANGLYVTDQSPSSFSYAEQSQFWRFDEHETVRQIDAAIEALRMP